MFAIIVYDINVSRVDKVKALLRQYLNWVQNSVFEGEITESGLKELKYRLSKIINPGEDSVIIYKLRSQKLVKKEEIGVVKGETGQIV